MSGIQNVAKNIGFRLATGFTASNPLFSLVNTGVQRVIAKQEADKEKQKAREAAYAEIEKARQRRELLLQNIENAIQGARQEAFSVVESEKIKNDKSIQNLQSYLNIAIVASLGFVAFSFVKGRF